MVTIRPAADEPDFDEEVNAALEQAVSQSRESFAEIFQIGPTRINAELKTSLLEDLKAPRSVVSSIAVAHHFAVRW